MGAGGGAAFAVFGAVVPPYGVSLGLADAAGGGAGLGCLPLSASFPFPRGAASCRASSSASSSRNRRVCFSASSCSLFSWQRFPAMCFDIAASRSCPIGVRIGVSQSGHGTGSENFFGGSGGGAGEAAGLAFLVSGAGAAAAFAGCVGGDGRGGGGADAAERGGERVGAVGLKADGEALGDGGDDFEAGAGPLADGFEAVGASTSTVGDPGNEPGTVRGEGCGSELLSPAAGSDARVPAGLAGCALLGESREGSGLTRREVSAPVSGSVDVVDTGDD